MCPRGTSVSVGIVVSKSCLLFRGCPVRAPRQIVSRRDRLLDALFHSVETAQRGRIPEVLDAHRIAHRAFTMRADYLYKVSVLDVISSGVNVTLSRA